MMLKLGGQYYDTESIRGMHDEIERLRSLLRRVDIGCRYGDQPGSNLLMVPISAGNPKDTLERLESGKPLQSNPESLALLDEIRSVLETKEGRDDGAMG